MIHGPRKLWEKFDRWMAAEGVPGNEQGQYRKWLRFYLDFCAKYHHEYANPVSLRSFVEKLASKRQTVKQREQAKRAVGIYYRMMGEHKAGAGEQPERPETDELEVSTCLERHNKVRTPTVPTAPRVRMSQRGSLDAGMEVRDVGQQERGGGEIREDAGAYGARGGERGAGSDRLKKSRRKAEGTSGKRRRRTEGERGNEDTVGTDSRTAEYTAGADSRFTGKGTSWRGEFAALKEAIEIRHYSPRTLKTYRTWVRKFQAFTKSKPPKGLSVEDVKAFLSDLAVSQGVSASTQNQAFNGLLFFFRHVLNKELLGHSDVKTTMIYTHTVPSRTKKERRSPLDLGFSNSAAK